MKKYNYFRIQMILGGLLLIVSAGHGQVADSSMRQVKLAGAVNCRDLGGYMAADGRHVRRRKVFRSADISKLTDSDLVVLREKQVRTVVDFRGTDESKRAPDRLNPGTDYILCPAGSDNNLSEWMKQVAALQTPQEGDSMMKVYYSRTEFLADRYKPFFAKLQALPDGEGLLFHCTAGKDRTGIGAALFLYALGIPFETILDDYTATNYYRKAENERMIRSMVQAMHVQEAVAGELLSAKREYLAITFKAIAIQYGSVDNFLKENIGLDENGLKALRDKFLE